MAASKESDKKAMDDVAKPGSTSPDTSGRPVLVTHRSIVQDPMVVVVNNASKTGEPEQPSSKKEPMSHGAKTLQPIDGSLKKDEPVAPVKTKPETTTAEEEAVVEAVAEQAAPKTKMKEGKLSPEEQAKQEHLQQLINDKTYFVPIGQVARRRNQQMTAVLIILLLAVIGGYLALDAGIIKNSIKLPIDFINNDKQAAVPAPVAPSASAPAAAVPASSTYVSKVDGFTFKYPNSWKLTQVKEGNEEATLVERKSPNGTNNQSVAFSRNKPATSLKDKTLVQVNYTDLPAFGRKAVLREIIYKDLQNRYTVQASIADAKTDEKINSNLTVLDTSFLAQDGKTPLQLNTIGLFVNDGKPGFSSLESAVAFTKSPPYTEAKNILLSAKLTKQ